METKFTKGEWVVYDNIVICNKNIIARLIIPIVDESRFDDESFGKRVKRIGDWKFKCRKEMRANAKLIAAAPELFNALINVLNIINDSEGVAGYHLNGDIAAWDEFEEIKQAEQAIKKATE